MTDDAPGTSLSHMTEALVTLSWTSRFHAHRIMRGGAFLIEAEIFYSKIRRHAFWIFLPSRNVGTSAACQFHPASGRQLLRPRPVFGNTSDISKYLRKRRRPSMMRNASHPAEHPSFCMIFTYQRICNRNRYSRAINR